MIDEYFSFSNTKMCTAEYFLIISSTGILHTCAYLHCIQSHCSLYPLDQQLPLIFLTPFLYIYVSWYQHGTTEKIYDLKSYNSLSILLCSQAYYGGEARCDAELGGEFDPAELVCGACSDVSRAQMCPKHGTDFLEYKCRYCCSVAVFFCFGTTHFCNACHDDFQRVTNIPRSELPPCPAGKYHILFYNNSTLLSTFV